MTEAANSREAFLAAEQARVQAEQARRKQSLNQRVTAEALAELEEQQVAEQPGDAEEFDPWVNLLKNVEARRGVKVVYDSDGNREYRIATRYLLETVIGAEPSHVNYSYASIRLGKLMRKLGWDGPKDLRMRVGNEKKARGYRKAAEAKAA